MDNKNWNTLSTIGYCYLQTTYDKAKAIPYFEDVQDDVSRRFENISESGALVAEVLTKGTPLFFTKREILDRSEKIGLPYIGAMCELWLGVPLKTKNHVIGAIVVQSTTVQQNTFVPLNATCIITVNALTGIIIWEDWRVVQNWLGYCTVFVQLIIGNYLLVRTYKYHVIRCVPRMGLFMGNCSTNFFYHSFAYLAW